MTMAPHANLPEEALLQRVLVRQVVTERSKAAQTMMNCWVFEVAPNASKTEIRRAVEKLYKVTVTRVTTLNVRGKGFSGRIKTGKGMKFFDGRKPGWKKAVIALKEGQRLPLA